jgi:hypothetical protein
MLFYRSLSSSWAWLPTVHNAPWDVQIPAYNEIEMTQAYAVQKLQEIIPHRKLQIYKAL